MATTSETAAAGRYEDNVQVLDAMIESLRVSDPKSTFSAGRSTPAPTRQRELWPTAYAFERWDDVPASARQELRRIYGDVDLRRFESLGSYVGHRVGITGSGDWILFVGGD